MKKTTIVAGTGTILVLVLVWVAGNRFVEQKKGTVDTTSSTIAPSTQAESDAQPGNLYGRVTTYDGSTYEGRLRWGGDEEAFWGNFFNGLKVENPWVSMVPLEHLTKERGSFEIFGFKIGGGERQTNLSRPCMMRFGDIVRIEAFGDGLWEVLEKGVEFDPQVRVTLKSGAAFDLDRLSAGDFDDGVRIWDKERGAVDLGPRQIKTIELLASEHKGYKGEFPDQLHGTVQTRQGDFTGFLQWDRKQALGSDEIVGSSTNGAAKLSFSQIRSIVRNSTNRSTVKLLDGSDMVFSGTGQFGPENKGIYVDDQRYGRVLISWDALNRVNFSPGVRDPSYDDFPLGHPLTGIVSTADGRRLEGRLVFDLDETETTETLDASSGGLNYSIPFGLISTLTPRIRTERGSLHAQLTLFSGEELQLERTGDLGDGNAGILIFVYGSSRPEFVPWSGVNQVELDDLRS